MRTSKGDAEGGGVCGKGVGSNSIQCTNCQSGYTRSGVVLLLLLLLLLHPFNGLFSRTTLASRYQKGKTSPDLNEARDDRVFGFSGIR